jgi:hypothetical protein
MGFVDAFVGTPQSKVAGITILIAVIVLSISLIFSNDKLPIAQKVGMAFLIFLMCIPMILYHLFQITCFVTGKGANGETWWCGVYAWIIVIISIIVIVATIYIVLTKQQENFYFDEEEEDEEDDDDEEESS